MSAEWGNRLSALIKSVGNLAKTNKPVANAFLALKPLRAKTVFWMPKLTN